MRKRKFKHFGLMLLFYFVFFFTYGQNDSKSSKSELGLPYITHYKPQDYKAFNQNWGAVQDSLGVLYFANGNGVLSYDGTHWKIIELPDKAHIKSIAIDRNNRIYVGASGKFGYLKPKPSGHLEYVSLISHLDEKDLDFGTVWKIHTTSQGVYFGTKKGIFFWDGNILKSWNYKIKKTFLLDDKVYAYIDKQGLVHFNNGKLYPLIPENQIAGLKLISLLTFDTNTLLLATAKKGLFLFRNGNVIKFKTKIDEYLSRNILYKGIKLSDKTYALGTLTDGALVINDQGEQILKFNNNLAGTSVKVLNLFQDTSGLLWLCLNDGIMKMEYPSPLTLLGEKMGINSRVQVITRYQNNLFAGTANGLYYLDHGISNKNASFKVFEEIRTKIWDLLVFKDRLLIVEENALFEAKNSDLKKIGNFNAAALLRSELDSNRVFIALANGLQSIYYKNGEWIDEGKIEGINGSTYTMVEAPSGDLWLETSEDWILRLAFSTASDAIKLENLKVKKYGAEQGLPATRGDLYRYKNEIYFASADSLSTYKYNNESQIFEHAKGLSNTLGMPDKPILINHVDKYGTIWFSTHDGDISTRWIRYPEEQTHASQNLKQNRIFEDIGGSETLFYEKKDSILWLTGHNTVIRHDLAFKKREDKNYRTLISNVSYRKDSVLLAGFYNSANWSVPFKNNSFRFHFTTPSFFDENKNQFQYKLEGFDQNWSSWTYETQKDYTNIPEGDYSFRVRARNTFGNIGQEDQFTFSILPPWYRAWWAYFLYLLAAVLLVWLFSQWRSKQLRTKNLVLEAVIDERTNEIQNKNVLLNNQAEKLKEMDTMKTRLFANISHEFRTPLTLIKGPIEKLEEEKQTQISLSNIKMIRRNANRLLNLVNQLLDLSKLDSGKLQLETAEGDVYKCIRAAASSFSSHGAQRNMDYQIRVPHKMLWASFDRDRLEKIIYNLLGNAFKFTPDHGTIVIRADFKNNELDITVKDSGKGMNKDKLVHIFDRFFQVDNSFTKEKSGSGIGLALTKELVELMEGNIYVESELKKGTVFKVVIPLEEIKSYSAATTKKKDQALPIDEIREKPPVMSVKKDVKVLIIEDNNDMRHFIKEQLNKEYEVLEAHNGKEGLQRVEKVFPDLIITDLMMPQMDGITLCKKLKTNITTSHIPVIMLTAKAGLENKLEGLETGADDYLTKPFNAKELQIRVKNLIEQRKQFRERYSKNISLDPKEITVTSMDEEFLKDVLAVMEENYMDPSFGVSQIQNALAMSKTQLHRKIKALTNHPPNVLFRNFRLKRAAQLLSQRGDNISQAAYDVGFNSLSYFTKCFKDLYGISPSMYIQKHKGTS